MWFSTTLLSPLFSPLLYTVKIDLFLLYPFGNTTFPDPFGDNPFGDPALNDPALGEDIKVWSSPLLSFYSMTFN